jgi:hypothetical protein
MNSNRYARKNWTLKKHSLNLDKWREWLEVFKVPQSSLQDSWVEILERMQRDGVYRPRNSSVSTSTLGSKLSDMSFFLMVYRKDNKHTLSEYGKLFLLYERGSLEESKVVATSLLETPLPNPSSSMFDCNIYPVRLVFWLLLQSNLSFYLSMDEVVLILFWQDTVDDADKIIHSIVEFRKKTDQEKLAIISNLNIGSDINRNRYGWEQATRTRLADITHQASYLKKALIGADLIKVQEGNIIDHFIHGNPSANQRTVRKLTSERWSLRDKIIPFIKDAFLCIDPSNKPLDDYPDLMSGNCFKLFDVLPDYLTDNLDLVQTTAAAESKVAYITRSNPTHESIQSLARLLLVNSKIGGTGVDFEYSIKDFFNLFEDITAMRLGGAGNTDVLATYGKKFRFNADGKSMKGGITTSIHAARLNRHLVKHNSEYCWVVGPGFSPGAILDISGHKIVSVRADTLAMFLRTWLTLGIDQLSYEKLDKIVAFNLGKSVDLEIRDLISEMSSKRVA